MKRRHASGYLQLSLTDREHTVLALIAEGLSNEAIAERLSLSRHTVAWHIKQVFDKLGVNRRTEAVALAHSLGVLGETPPAYQSRAIIPLPLTPLVGREKELSQLLALLADPGVRLVTIHGPGGVGKTRLALAAAHELHERSMPVHFVQLEGLASAEHVIPAIADSLQLHFHGQLDPRHQLLLALHNRMLVLVLDNFEHLLNMAPFVAEMLASSPRLKALVTSRECLNVHGERIMTLDGLAYPSDEDSALSYSAIELFVQIAHQRRPDLQPDAEDLQHIRRICRLVEGLPLALELAAGWIHVLSPAQIADEIEQRLDILETSARDVPARHQNIHAVFLHSWHLLTEDEQAAFACLSVFQGRFTGEAGEYVANTSLRILLALLDKSLIRVGAIGHYSIHELLRQFGANRLANDAEAQTQARTLHARYYLNFLSARQVDLESQRFPEAVRECRQEMDNLWIAWRSASELGLVLELSQAARSFTILHTSSGLVPALSREMERVITDLRSQPQSPSVNLALARMSLYLAPVYAQPAPETFLRLVEEAGAYLCRLESVSDVDWMTYITFKGTALVALEEFEETVDLLRHSMIDHRPVNDDPIQCFASAILAIALIELDRHEEAWLALKETRDAAECYKTFAVRAHFLPLFALASLGIQALDEAHHYLLETVEEHRRYPHLLSYGLMLLGIAAYLVAMKSFEGALELMYLYFQPVFTNLYLNRKARNLVNVLESQLLPDTSQALAQKAQDWISESPSAQNPVGLRSDFLNYVLLVLAKSSK